MSKKYYGADEVLNSIDDNITSGQEKLRKIMIQKPNFDKLDQLEKKAKGKSNNSQVIYRRKHYIIIKTSNSYIVHNKKKQFKEGHTHTNNFNYAKSLIDLSIRKKVPKKIKSRIISSLIRISEDYNYIKKLGGLKNEFGRHEKK